MRTKLGRRCYICKRNFNNMELTQNEVRVVCVALLGMMTFLLAVLPRHVTKQRVYGNARWMLALGTALLGAHFAVQFWLQRKIEIPIGMRSMVNLLFCMPSSYFLNISLLYLMRDGKICRHEWLAGIAAYVVSVCALKLSSATSGHIIYDGDVTLETKRAVSLVGFLYYLLLIYYNFLRLREYFRLRRKLSDYYDDSINSMVKWFKWSIPFLALSAMVAPVVIFMAGNVAKYYAIFVSSVVFYYAFQFVCYGVGSGAVRVSEAIRYSSQPEKTPEAAVVTEERKLSEAEKADICGKIEQWKNSAGFTDAGITIVAVAKLLEISVANMRLYLKQTDSGTFSQWVSRLRVEHSKALLCENPDFSIDAIADLSGFSNHSNFIRAFKREVGVTPNEWKKGKE